jgi:hypothetical protein
MSTQLQHYLNIPVLHSLQHILYAERKDHRAQGSPSKSTLLSIATAVKHQLQNYTVTTEDE